MVQYVLSGELSGTENIWQTLNQIQLKFETRKLSRWKGNGKKKIIHVINEHHELDASISFNLSFSRLHLSKIDLKSPREISASKLGHVLNQELPK